MFKTVAFACAALAFASAQNLQDLANQANTLLAPALNQEVPVTQNGDSISLNVNDYEWTLTEVNGEYELSVNQLATNANNLAPTLSALLANAGVAAQDNNNAAQNVLDAEAANVGVDIENSGALADVAGQYGAQLADSSSPIADLANQQYSQAAAALASNANGVTDQVNSQINDAVQNQESLSGAVNTGVNAAVDNVNNNADALTNLANENVPVEIAGDVPAVTEAATNAAINAAGDVGTEQAVANANDLANQALNAGVNAANDNLSSGLASGVQSAANSASASAATSLNSAAESLNANNVDNLSSAAALVNPNQ